MKIIELSKKYCMNCYGGNYDEMIKNQDGIIFDDEMIHPLKRILGEWETV